MANPEDPAVQPSSDTVDGDEPQAPLRAYLLAKQSVAQLLRDLREFVERSAPWASERAHELMARLSEDRFQLVVVGQFKRGKSSLMNAIVGQPLLPTGMIPVTSAITSLRYGSTLRAVIRRAGQSIDQQIPLSALPDFITERGNPENRKEVLSAEIEVPAPFLRRGLHFIDTPGIGSAHEHNTVTTLGFLPEADAAIFVTGADGPLSDVELQFLDAVREHARKLFFVLNKIDQVDPREREEVVRYTAALLAKRLGRGNVRVFPFSATQALAVGRTNANALAASGLPELESALAMFLNEERRVVFLVAVLDRALAMLEETRFMLDLRRRALDQTALMGDDAIADLHRRIDELERARQDLIDRGMQRIAEWQAAVLEPSLERFAADARQMISADLPYMVQEFSATSRDHFPLSDEWLGTQVGRQAATWMRGFAGEVDDFIRTLVRETQPSIAAIMAQPSEVAASVFGIETHAQRSAPQDTTHWHWTPPGFEAPNHGPALNIAANEVQRPRAPLPRALSVRLTLRRLSQRLPEHIQHTVGALRDVVIEHLHACITDMDRSSQRHLNEECERVKSVIRSDAKSRQTRAGSAPDALSEHQRLVAGVTATRDALFRGNPLPPAELAAQEEPIASSVDESGDAQVVSRSEDHTARRVTGTCAICAVASDAVFDFLCHYQYAVGHDAALQRQFLASRGLCPTHTWHLERLSSPREISLVYSSLLDQMEESIRTIANQSGTTALGRLGELAAHANTCAACLARRKAEQREARRLVQTLSSAQGRVTFEQSQWLCLAHLALVLTGVEDEVGTRLLRLHARRLGELSESMREFVIKHDARRRALMTEEETRAYRRALVSLVGERYLFRTEPEE